MNSILHLQRVILILLSVFTLCPTTSFSQELSKTDKEQMMRDSVDKPILALGDATHSDYSASKYRIELIKELVASHNYTIIGIGSNLYELYKAYEQFKINEDITL